MLTEFGKTLRKLRIASLLVQRINEYSPSQLKEINEIVEQYDGR